MKPGFYKVSWIEKHEAMVRATDEEEAVDKATSGKYDTFKEFKVDAVDYEGPDGEDDDYER